MRWRKYDVDTSKNRTRVSGLTIGIVCVTVLVLAITVAVMSYPRPSLFMTPGQKSSPRLFAGLNPHPAR